jgi:hypothetical protein
LEVESDRNRASVTISVVKVTNLSKRERLRGPVKPEFGISGIAIGLFAGMFFGFVAEVVWHHSMLVMFAGEAAGCAVGAVVEGIRYWSRSREFRAARKT